MIWTFRDTDDGPRRGNSVEIIRWIIDIVYVGCTYYGVWVTVWKSECTTGSIKIQSSYKDPI